VIELTLSIECIVEGDIKLKKRNKDFKSVIEKLREDLISKELDHKLKILNVNHSTLNTATLGKVL